MQHYVIKVVSDLRQVCGFLRAFWFSPPIKLTAAQCLKWTVAQSPNATNILFGRPKAAPN